MAFRLATFAARRIPLCSFVRSTVFFSVSRDADNTKIDAAFVREADNTRIDCARNNGNQLEFTSFLKADIYSEPELKPDIIIYSRHKNRDDDRCGNFGSYSLEEDGTITMSPKYNINPPSFLLDHYFFGTSCNGIFYFRGPRLGHALWNPTTCEYKLFLKPDDEPPPHHIYKFLACGMWYGHGLQDCKVVNLVSSCLEDLNHATSHFDLYSLKTNSWKRIPCPYIYVTSQACVSGILYCATDNAILSFDISNETFSYFPLPDDWKHGCSQILEYKGLLSALAGLFNGKYQLWIMRYGYWRREIVFHIPFHGVMKPIWFSQDGKLLYSESLRNELFVFDCVTGKLKNLDGNIPMRYRKMFPLVENFVQLDANFNAISCIV